MGKIPFNVSGAGLLRVVLCAIPLLLALQMLERVFSYTISADHARYVLLARSIAEGYGYTEVHISGNPAPVDYPPPLFPLILSFVYMLAGYNFMWMHLVVIVFYIAGFFLARAYFEGILKEEQTPHLPLFLALLFATNPVIIHYSKEILPEIPFIFSLLLGLYVAQRYSNTRELLPYGVYLPAVVLLSVFMKNHGIVLYVAICMVVFVRFFKEREGLYLKQLLLLSTVTILPVALWFARDVLMGRPSGTSFVRILAEVYDPRGGGFFQRVAENMANLIYHVPESVLFSSLFKGLPQPVWYVLLGVVFAVTAVGFMHHIVNRRGFMEIALLLYILIIVMWPVYGADMRRYNVICIPFIYYYFMAGLMVLKDRLNPGGTGLKAILWVPLFLLLFVNVYEKRGMLLPHRAIQKVAYSVELFYTEAGRYIEHVELDAVTTPLFQRYFPCYHNYLLSSYSLRELAPEGTLVVTRRPEMVALVSERRAVRFPYTLDEGRMLSYLKKLDVDYILTDSCFPETARFLIPFVKRAVDVLEHKGRHGDSEIFRVRKALL